MSSRTGSASRVAVASAARCCPMEQDTSQPTTASSSAKTAFDELRAEVSLLRRAIERLTDERTSVPDYAPTLASIDQRLADLFDWARELSRRPGIKLSPKDLANELAIAGAEARRSDAAALAQARDGFEQAAQRIEAMIVYGRTAAEQARQVRLNRAAFLTAGMLLWAIIPGVVARALPESWAIPERMAARALRLDMGQAGERLLRTADPAHGGHRVERERPRTSSGG